MKVAYHSPEIIKSFTPPYNSNLLPAITYNITKRIKKMVLICSFGNSKQPGQLTLQVFKPLSGEGTYLGEILGKGKQKYLRLRYSISGWRLKALSLMQNNLTWNISACPCLKYIPVHTHLKWPKMWPICKIWHFSKHKFLVLSVSQKDQGVLGHSAFCLTHVGILCILL